METKTQKPGFDYEWEERIAICMESGMTLEEATAVARSDRERKVARELAAENS